MYVDFGSLAQQGFLTPFAGREHSSQVKGADSKKRRSHFFDTLKGLPSQEYGRQALFVIETYFLYMLSRVGLYARLIKSADCRKAGHNEIHGDNH